jgi:hypothetical protein
MYRTVQLFIAALIFFLFSCNNSNESESVIGRMDETDLESVFFDYKISAEEGDDNLTIMLQFRFDDIEGESIIIDDGGKVELDGEQILPDSSGLTGAYYEINKPIQGFAGDHEIVFYHGNRRYKEKFSFHPVSFKTELPDTIKRENITIELNGLDPEDYVRLIMFDTTANDGINRLDTTINGRIEISQNDLAGLRNGEIQLELHRENDKPVENGTHAGGRLLRGYVLKRSFILRD